MNKYMLIGRSQICKQHVDVHAVAQFRCDFAKMLKWVTHRLGAER